MSVRFDLTAIGPELMDAVIYMDGSPAYEAFKEEIEAILAKFNETNHLSSVWTVDAADLTANSEGILKNMHRAFLFWSYHEEKVNGIDIDCCCHTLGKLFFKSQEKTILEVNGGEDTIAPSEAKAFIERFKERIASDDAAFTSVKDYFKGYVYGYFFNYLKEARIMKNYAEVLAYLGVISNIIPTSMSEQQKALSKMAPLLTNDRFKFVYGFVPLDGMLDIIYDRIEFAGMAEDEVNAIKSRMRNYIISNYRTDNEDGLELIGDDVTASFYSSFFADYISVSKFGSELYEKTTSGVRTFLDCDRDDTGNYNAAKLCEIISDHCEVGYNSFFTSERDACNDTALAGNELCWKYPVIYMDAESYWFASTYEEHIYPVLDNAMFVPADTPAGMFPFADKALTTNSIREAGGIGDITDTVRRDRLAVLEQLKRLSADTLLSERDRKMLMLEQMLCLVSGNCSKEKYDKLLADNFYGTDLYEEYIRYRMDNLVNKALSNQESKKKLLDEVNKII